MTDATALRLPGGKVKADAGSWPAGARAAVEEFLVSRVFIKFATCHFQASSGFELPSRGPQASQTALLPLHLSSDNMPQC